MEYESSFLLLLIVFISCTATQQQEHEQQETCVHVDTWPLQSYDVSEIGCPNSSICNDTFIVSYVTQLEVYYKYDNDEVRRMLDKCCGNCFLLETGRNFTNHTEISSSTIRQSHFVYPVLGKSNSRKLYGYYFMPFFDAPGAIYVSKKEEDASFSNVFHQLIPMIIICLLMALLAGFGIWISETRINRDEFPTSFLIGWFNGFWWAVVTMTTVGYGDKTPKSVCGKLCSVSWIFVGLISCGIITAQLTSKIIEANTLTRPDMKDKNVGMINYHDYEGYIIAKHEGMAKHYDGPDYNTILLKLTDELRAGKINGFLIEKLTLWHMNTVMITKWNDALNGAKVDRLETIEFFLKETIRTEKTYDGPKLSWGILTKYKEHYRYFVELFRDNHFNRERVLAEKWIEEKNNPEFFKEDTHYTATELLFTFKSSYFRWAAGTLAVLLVCISLFGVGFECQRKKKNSEVSRENLSTL